MSTTVMFAILIGGASIGMLIYTYRRARDEAPYLFEDHASSTVAVDHIGVTLTDQAGASLKLPWTEVVELRIRTTDQGPLVEDVFWELDSTDARPALVVPGASVGIDEFLDAAPDHLDGFDHEAVIDAMGSTDHAVFLVWRAAG